MTGELISSAAGTSGIAASLARYGWEIFPVRVDRVTENGRERREKTPLISDWTRGAASKDPGDIYDWWTKRPWAHIGVFAGGSGLVTVDIDRNYEKDGFVSLARAGIELPPTLHYRTLGGGEHHVYTAPPGEWTLGSDIKAPDGAKLPGVDVRAGGSYFVYYGDRLAEAPHLVPAPEFALISAGASFANHDLKVEDWLALLPDGPASTGVLTALQEVRPQGMSHDDMLHSVGLLVRLGRDYHGGVRDALARGREIYTAGWGPKYGRMWDLALEGSITHFGPPIDLSFELETDGDSPLTPRPEPVRWNASEFGPDDAFVANENGRGKRLDPELLRRVVNPHNDLIMGVDERIWRYEEGRYLPDDDAPVRRAVQVLRNQYRKDSGPLVRDMVVHGPGFPRLTDDPPDPSWINLRNGMYEWRSRQLLPHSPSYRSMVQLPLIYDPEATCPTFETWLAQIFEPDMIQVAWEVIAYALMPGNPFQMVALLVGPPRSGKGTFLRVLERMLGTENVAHVTPQAMNDRWAPATLYGKLANFVGDASSREVLDTARFKMIVGGDRILVDQKNKPLFEFTPWCFHVVAANQLIGSDDPSGGWARRWLPVPLARSVPIDPDFDESRLHDEIPGIFNRAVAILPELIDRKRFTETLSMIEPMAEIRVLSDQVALWLAEDGGVTSDPGDPTLRTDRHLLYQRYRMWAASTGNEPCLNAQDFYKRLRALGYGERKSGNHRYMTGLAINPNADVLASFLAATK